MDFISIWHELQENRAWQQLFKDLRDARRTCEDIKKMPERNALTKYERDYIDYHLMQLNEAIGACNDYYARFLAQHEKN
jgi:hypothetical protein